MKKTIGQALDAIIESSVGKHQRVYLSEKEKQVSLAPKNVSQEPDNGESKKQKSDGADNDKDEKALADVPELDQIIEKLNLIRSGKSLKDSIIQQRFEGYFDDLSAPERVALFAYLKGIAQIVNGDIEPQFAQEPSDDPANVRMHKGKKVQKVSKEVKPNLIKKPSKPQGVKTSHKVEDDSAPVKVKS